MKYNCANLALCRFVEQFTWPRLFEYMWWNVREWILPMCVHVVNQQSHKLLQKRKKKCKNQGRSTGSCFMSLGRKWSSSRDLRERKDIYIHTYIYYRGGWKWNRISWDILRRVRLKKSALTKRKARPRVSNTRVYFGDVICNTLQFFHMWFCLCQFLSSQLSSLLHPFIISCIFPSFPNFSSSCPLPFGPSPWTPFINAYSEMLH